jgi:hypothetical protein
MAFEKSPDSWDELVTDPDGPLVPVCPETGVVNPALRLSTVIEYPPLSNGLFGRL